jgi:transcription termination factor Rho
LSADLSKSMLASKDKDELTQIAQAMGVKPASRARKADIIDLIMELATGGGDAPTERERPSDSDEGADDGADAAPVYSADPMADVRAAEAKEHNGRNDDSRGSRRNAGDTGRTKGRDRHEASAEGKGAKGRDGSAKEARSAGGNDAGSGGNDAGSGGNDAGSAGNDADHGARNGNGGNSDDNDNEPTEPGNRRRRRRGRGRDRVDQNEEFVADPVAVEGVLDLRDDGYGFLRVNGFLPTREDVYVSVKQVRQHGLRKGDHLVGLGRPANRSEKNPAMMSVSAVNGRSVTDSGTDAQLERRDFESLTSVLPTERLALEREDDPENRLARVVDLLAPIGKGTRGLVVSPTGVGRTSVLRAMAGAVETNHPDVKLIVVLVDERPEEITEMERLVLNGDVVTSSFEQAPEEHASVVDLALERAKRLVEMGEDVVIIFDGITRLARANNLAAAGNSQVSANGISAASVYPAKRLFGAARNLEEGGSLTIIAAAQADSGSAIDQFVLDEFAGAANMELRLDADAANQRITPPLDVTRCNTRNEDRLFEEDELNQVAALRRAIATASNTGGSSLAGLDFLIERLDATDTNADLLKQLT